jgi:hypothetical protein
MSDYLVILQREVQFLNDQALELRAELTKKDKIIKKLALILGA